MAYGDGPFDKELREAWYSFCGRLMEAGDKVFKDQNPGSSIHRADGFRFLTQNLSQAFDLALETKDTRFPAIHAFCAPHRKLGGDNADFIYLQAWIDGQSTYKISGNKGSARFMNFTVQGPRPEVDAYYGSGFRNLSEPFGDTPEANLFGDELEVEWDGSFVLYIGGPRREPNWLPTTPGSRKLFLRQGFDRWEEESAQFRIERVDMDKPRPVPTHQTILDAVAWAQEFLGTMDDWPDWSEGVARGRGEDIPLNCFSNSSGVVAGAEGEREERRGRALRSMKWRLAEDEALVVEFDNYDGFWMFTNMGVFENSMDYAYRNVSYTPSRAVVDSDKKVRLIMTHDDPGYHNWLDTQGFETGFLAFRNIRSSEFPAIRTAVVKAHDLATHLPNDCRQIDSGGRRAQLRARYDGIRRRYRI